MNKQITLVECPTIELSVSSTGYVGKAIGTVCSDGIWWKKLRGGFWWPLDFSSPVDVGRKPPRFKFLGYQHLNYSNKSNSFIRYMFIEDLQKYDVQSLKTSPRNEIRQSFRNLEVRRIQEYEDKEAKEAADCWNELVERTEWRKKMDKDTFSKYWKGLLSLPGHTIIGAYYEGLLVGWLVGITFDNGNCYLTRYASLKEYFKLRVNNGIIYAFLMSAKNFGGRTMNFGLFTPERPGLDKFKENLGFKLTPFPAYTFINPLVKPITNTFFKKEINRLTGLYYKE